MIKYEKGHQISGTGMQMLGYIQGTFLIPFYRHIKRGLPELEVDVTTGVVRVNRRAVSLSPKEYLLIAYLYERRGQVCSIDDIGHAVWPEYEAGGIFDYQIENLVRRLRTRIELDPASPQILFTVRGLGYKLMVA